jgi:hypothetical protein
VTDRPAPRSGEQRVRDAIAILEARHADVWVASASPEGEAHLVPLSLGWIGERIVVVLDRSSVTARNVSASRAVRVAAGGTRDVVMIDAALTDEVAIGDAPPDLLEAYARQADWDPRVVPDDLVVLVLQPRRIQVWREANELAGRTVMRDGRWLP